MNDYDLKLKQRLDDIPAVLKESVVPLLRVQRCKYVDRAKELEKNYAIIHDPGFIERKEEYMHSNQRIYDDFLEAGGTFYQWSVIAPAVHYGDYDRLQI